MNFYVYVYLDTRKPGEYIYNEFIFDYEPIYIGKGKKERCFSHLNKAKNILKKTLSNSKKINQLFINKLLSILKDDKEPIIYKIYEKAVSPMLMNTLSRQLFS